MKPSQTAATHFLPSRRTLSRPWFVLWLAVPLLAAGSFAPAAAAEDEAAVEAAVEKRLADAVRYLASDELEGRGVGTKGIDLAADYIARQFAQLGLKTELFDGTPFQHLTSVTKAELGPENELALVGPPKGNGEKPDSIELKLGEDFSPLAASGAGKFDLPLVFVGYGITAKEEGYDDYAGVDVGGKAVIVLRHEPQQADPNSVFNGTKDSAHVPLRRKLANAHEHGAAAVVFCTDQFEIRKKVDGRRRQWQQALDRLAAEAAQFKKVDNPTLQQTETQHKRIDELLGEVQRSGEMLRAEYDPVLLLRPGGRGGPPRDFPVVHCRRAALDRAVKAALGTGLAELEEKIDAEPKPHSRELAGWRL
ncbi:MAG: protease-associated domain-containing protein, partial [Planctomycetota bacterium]